MEITITTRTNGNWIIIGFDGKLNEITSKPLIQEIDNQIQSGSKSIILDFAGINFINSSGLGSLVSISKKLKQNNGSLRLINVQPFILDILSITKLQSVFAIFENEQKAVI